MERAMNQNILAKISEAVKKFEQDQTDPHILVMGSTGVGKSSLINSIFGQKINAVNTVESTTRSFSSQTFQLDPQTKIIITDSPGYGEVGYDDAYAREVVVEAAKAHIVALVLKADEKGYARDLAIVGSASKDPAFSIEKPLLIALNQVDKVKPSREWSPPYELDTAIGASDSEKVRNMKEKLALVRQQFRDVAGLRQIVVVPTMADEDEGDSFGIDSFKLAIFRALPDVAKFRFARAVKLAEKASADVLIAIDKAADDVISTAAGMATAAVVVNPIPASDFVALSGIQIGMVIKLGALYGRSLTYQTAVEALTAMGAGFAARTLFQGVMSLLPPGAKQLLGGAFAAAATSGMGQTAKSYFKNGTVPSEAEIRKTIEAQLRQQGG